MHGLVGRSRKSPFAASTKSGSDVMPLVLVGALVMLTRQLLLSVWV
jgi:hypothetical protein